MTEPDLSLHRHPPRSLLFARTRESLADALSAAVTDVLPAIADELDAAAERALDGRERQSLLNAASRLRRETATRVTRVADALARRAERCLEASRRADEQPGVQGLALVDHEELEAQILAADLARAARERAGVVYPRYAARLRQTVDHDWGDDDLNPLGARTLASAAVASLDDLAEGPRTRATLRQLAVAALAAPVAEAIERAERLLDEAGVQPLEPPEPEPPEPEPPAEPQRALPVEPGRVPSMQSGPLATPDGETAAAVPEPEAQAQATPVPDATPATAASEAALPGVERRSADAARAIGATLQAERDAATLGSSPLAGAAPGERLRVLPTLQPVLEIERDAVAFAHAIGAMPYSRQARAGFFGNVRTRMRESGAAPAQVAVVDLVAAMFDYVIDDRRLPEAAKPLVWRLQQPAVALTLLDPAYLGDDPRSLRRLVEHFGAISTAFGEDIVRGSELYRRLETVVRAVEIVSSALQSRSAVMAQQVEKEYSRAARSVSQLIDRVARERRTLEETPSRRNRRDYTRRPNREREKQVTERLQGILVERLDRHRAPDSVREFVANVWLRHMRTAMLRNGEESAEFRVSLQVVDDLLWSLDERDDRRSRRELAQRIPPLIRLMTQGVREIGAKDEEFKPFFDELFLVHLRRMQRRERERGATTRMRVDEGGATVAGVPMLGQPIGEAAAAPRSEADEVPLPAPGGEPELRPGEGDEGSEGAAGTLSPTAPRPTATQPPPAAPHTVPAAMPAVPVEPSAAPDGTPAQPSQAHERGDDEGTERRLLEILESLDLTDLPAQPRRRDLPPAQSLERMRRGDWIELVARDGASTFLKVAWINRRRTVALLVRHADRRAMSLRTEELGARFEQRRAWLLDDH
ncbi:MAG: DUF1631 family protein [Burkholderiaceae bacterium]|nr:DUF1631 family protein [Burkholderiaceae bacterium]